MRLPALLLPLALLSSQPASEAPPPARPPAPAILGAPADARLLPGDQLQLGASFAVARWWSGHREVIEVSPTGRAVAVGPGGSMIMAVGEDGELAQLNLVVVEFPARPRPPSLSSVLREEAERQTGVHRRGSPLVLGAVDAGLAEKVIDHAMPRFTGCFTALPPATRFRSVRLKLRVPNGGGPTDVLEVQGTDGAAGLSGCLREVATSLRFPPPRGKGIALVRTTIVSAP